MELLKSLAGASATVMAALIAAAITFLVSVFTKESKISEFRQAWIDALRNDLAEFVGVWWHLINTFDREKKSPDILDRDQFWEQLKPEILKLEELQTRIELRLNPDEHKGLIKQVQLLGGASEFVDRKFDDRKAAIDQLTTDSQEVLRNEWRKVKRGEPTYLLVKELSLAAFIVAGIALCATFL